MGERRGERYLWRTADRAPKALFDAIKDIHPAVVQVMYRRGLDTADRCIDFLAGVCSDPDDPLLLADVSRAVERLVHARQHGESVAVFTDYDADGVNAAAVLATGLRLLGITPRVRLPNRFRDGYGLSPEIVDELYGHGARVIVTADCGSTAFAAADRARDLGVDLLITDHHQCTGELPRVHALVNPWRPDCQYPCDFLCGAGVAYKLLQALADRLHPDGRAVMEPLLDLVAVATVADIMPLVGENRKLVMQGLRIMNAFPRPGVRALVETAGLKPGEVDAQALGFRVGPRVNAAGRLDDPTIAFNLLMSDSYEEAFALAEQLDGMNKQRQTLTREYEALAAAALEPRVAAGAHGLVYGGAEWPQGIVGLVAGSMVKLYHRPALVYTIRDGLASGSGRSVEGFNLLEAMHACGTLFTRYGGHHAAAGFAMPPENIPQLAERFDEAVRTTITQEQMQPLLVIDGFLRPESVSLDLLRSLEHLAPYGAGFPHATFAMKNLLVTESLTRGDANQHWHLKLRSPGDWITLRGISWGNGAYADRYRPGARIDAAFRLRRNEWRGNVNVELEVQDVAPAAR